MSSPAMALVDDRMSTEGTGLPFGLSNNLLGWILLGVFASSCLIARLLSRHPGLQQRYHDHPCPSTEPQHQSLRKETSQPWELEFLVATAALTAVMSSPAMALVDDRMSTEGTGLPFGLSNNLLGWILLGVFGLIWTFYFTYTSSLDEDEESGLSL
ncbi:hypothetical protein Bca52824_048618 [Brassica carinata]|uniref:PSII 6.1 kDa protein n=2 Tax=Brassica TaxID=3705 RepID=A0A8X7RP06_BRACI|nr:hypothetical protein Bca52824_048618 [Brassica carinata]